MELRLLLAFLLMGVVLFVTPYFYKTVAPPPGKKAVPAAPANTAAPATPSVSNVTPPPPAAAPAPNAPLAVAQQEQTQDVDTHLFHIVFSNRGAVVKSWLLKKYKEHNGKPLDLVNIASQADKPMAFYFPAQKPSVDLNQALYEMHVAGDGLSISFDYSNGSVVAEKSFTFRNSDGGRDYLLDVSAEVSEGGKPIPAEIEWRGGFGDMGAPNPSGDEQTLYYNLADGKLNKNGAKAAKNGPVTAVGNYSFAGVEDKYFVAAFLPGQSALVRVKSESEAPRTVSITTFTDNETTPGGSAKAVPFAGAAVGDGSQDEFSLYVGPKDVDTLRAVNPRLEQVVDFGWLSILAKPLFLLVNWVALSLIHNYGWAIVLVTIVLNFVLFPLKITSMKSMKKMQALQPQISAINDKYKNVSIRDPRKAEQNQEVMELYKKHGVNPLGGCIPMVLQIPFFIAFYKVFSVAVEMRGASWLWVTDLSQPETLPIRVLPIVMIISQFAMQKMTPTTTGGDPSQQKIMQLMPLFLGFMFYNFSSGLILYYLTSNLVGIAQQWFFNRTSLAAVAAQSVQPPKKKKDGKK